MGSVLTSVTPCSARELLEVVCTMLNFSSFHILDRCYLGIHNVFGSDGKFLVHLQGYQRIWGKVIFII